MGGKKTKQEVQSELNVIQENGIQADCHHLKQNMCTQFADPFEFAREYVVNSYDAMATACYISGREDGESVTITIRDNGRGMDRQRIQDFFRIFRSRKDSMDTRAIGCFGVGKMSVAAVPGLIRFAGTTSTGSECWRFETDTMIDDRPVTLEQIEPVPASGTRFEITFKRSESLSGLLSKIHAILYKYVRFLTIDVYFDLPEVDENFNPVRKKLEKGKWQFDRERLGKACTIQLNGVPTEVLMEIGGTEHEIYQNKVYITSKYNLISYGLTDEFHIPHITIRVNSGVFKLTFGRHCLSNETILADLARSIREKILPDYFNYLMSAFSEDFLIGSPELVEKIEEIACSLMAFLPGGNAWCNFQLFKVHGLPRLSFNELSAEVEKHGILYIEASGHEGTDYSVFDAPVLKLGQPAGALELISSVFGTKAINLDQKDVVIEMSPQTEITLSTEEKLFEQHLVFKPKKDVMDWIITSTEKQEKKASETELPQSSGIRNPVGICEEARSIEEDFYNLEWKLNYLVERDGKTPCCSRKFMCRKNTIVLNLYHPEIKDFIELSRTNTNLAAHWAMAMCLSDPKLLPHITSEAREDLLLIDAMGRMNSDFILPASPIKRGNRNLIDFIRNCGQ